MDTINETFSRDHKQCDQLFAEAESAASAGDWPKAAELYEEFQSRITRHMDIEEQVLFPAIEERAGGPIGPTQVMRSEHEEMRDLLARMAQSVTTRDTDDFLGLSDTLLILMQQHNLKEEEVLYHMADQMLGGEAAGVLARMEELAE
ncbi:MAG: hemerythrin domain-containing protein [Gammaproteobacteria bacterium]|nr:hemerythrin domain-containing protein [Gammaproteobacteria bacterium]NIR84871.1 hemerythrin domain-containing protein [Gammaproteobacteria bacterium]NIR91720.1 hemerythrin domain-containing protein [Gammaproteobacteria bacterium]NIU05918.1 hemerythrin domain-containing protein [Gammaproteobacteria bacterium]NIV52965.1 hemerythrin domain-containing protein [Gammaproteobacteria bacterium]